MNITKKVLVFPCGSEIGLELYRSLSNSTHIELYGASSISDHGSYVYERYTESIPSVDDENFIEAINDFVRRNSIDFIFPAHDSVVLKLSQNQAQLACDVVTSSAETCEVSRSKAKTYKRLQAEVAVPNDFTSLTNIPEDSFPVFLKPDVGQGSKGTATAYTQAEVDQLKAKDDSLLVLEYLPGREYTVDCFTNRNGKLLVSEGRQRARISNGISVRSQPVKDDRFTELAHKINAAMNFQGVWFYQVKERINGELVLMEIAPRIAGTMGLLRARGVNLALMSIFDRMGFDVAVLLNEYDVVVDRALENKFKLSLVYKHVYIDFDDLIFKEGKVNPQVITYLVQCLNKKISLHLITRHAEDLTLSLKRLRLAQLFDEIIWLQKGERKSAFITETDSIFIDDSFSERLDVKETLGIPVFDEHMIECLMEL
jgi:predicted ATP-grasp superfamily ATP-dependent carboligase